MTLGHAFTLEANLSSSASTCLGGKAVTFTLDTNPLTGVGGNYVLGSATTTQAGVAAAAPTSTTGWLEGAYVLTARFVGTASCAGSFDESTLTVASPGAAAAGGGWYTLSGSGRTNFGFVVQQVPRTNQYRGQLTLVNRGSWRFKGTFDSYVTSGGKGSASGTGSLYWWNQSLSSGLGGWQLASSSIPFTISFTPGSNGKANPGTFGIKIVYTPVAPQPATLPNSVPQVLKGGSIVVH